MIIRPVGACVYSAWRAHNARSFNVVCAQLAEYIKGKIDQLNRTVEPVKEEIEKI